MKSLVQKFKTGIQIDAKDTLVRTAHYVFQKIGETLSDGLYFVSMVPLSLLPVRSLARIKNALVPLIRLDYPRRPIKLHADSLFDIYRARACEKEPETVEWIETYVKKGEVFFDIATNIGAYSLVACAHLKGQITVVAFEPSFSSFYQLCRNILVNNFQKSITPYLMALSSKPEQLSFNYHSLEAGSADHQLGGDLSKTTQQFVYTQQLLAFSIDYLIQEFDFPVPNHIKLDVDGAEVDVLSGAAETLKNNQLKSILIEVRDRDGISRQVDQVLRDAGFQLVSRTDRGNNVTWNCVYARDHLDTTRLTNIERNEGKK